MGSKAWDGCAFLVSKSKCYTLLWSGPGFWSPNDTPFVPPMQWTGLARIPDVTLAGYILGCRASHDVWETAQTRWSAVPRTRELQARKEFRYEGEIQSISHGAWAIRSLLLPEGIAALADLACDQILIVPSRTQLALVRYSGAVRVMEGLDFKSDQGKADS
jgi:hypothetical protein